MVESARPDPPPRASWIDRWLHPSLVDVAFVASLVLVLMTGQNLTNRDGDLGRHLAVGQHILSTASVPVTDVFSHTLRDRPFVPHEWLAEAAFALSYRAAGFRGVAWLTALCIAVPFAGLLALMLRRGVGPLVAWGVFGLGLLASMAHWAARPHVFSFVFAWLWTALLDDLRRGERRHVWWLVPLTVLWANTHGAFIVGFVLIATFLAGEVVPALIEEPIARAAARRRAAHLALVLALCVAASALNPRGPALMANSFGYLGEDYLLEITPEYGSPDFHHPLFAPYLVLLLLALVVSVRRQLVPTLLLVSWVAFSLYSLRNIALFVVVCLPFIGEGAQDYLTDLRRGLPGRLARLAGGLVPERAEPRGAGARPRASLVSALAVVLLAAFLLAGGTLALDRSDYGFRDGDFPLEAMRRLADSPPGARVFNRLDWGGYVLFAAWPRIPVFIDGQTDFYGAELTRQYARAFRAEPGWREVLDRYAVDWVLLRPRDALARSLAGAPGWRPLYRDGVAVVYVRGDRPADPGP